MNWFYNMKISKKLFSSFVIVSLLAGVLGVVGVINIKSGDSSYSALYTDYGAGMAELGYLGMDVINMRTKVRDLILHSNDQDIQKDIEAIKAIDDDVAVRLGRVEPTLRYENEKSAFAALKKSITSYSDLRGQAARFRFG